MSAGRPYNSTTPAWRSKPCLKVCAYKLYCHLKETEATKSECARVTGLSRTTVIKWWNTVDWECGDFKNFDEMFYNQALRYSSPSTDAEGVMNITHNDNPQYTIEDIAEECGVSPEKARLLEEIRKEYVNMNVYRSKEYDLERVKVVGLFDSYCEDGLYYSLLGRSRQKAVWKGKRRWKR